MLVIRTWNFLRGYVIIGVEGLNLERFINLSVAKGIYLWDVKKVSYSVIQTKVSIRGYKLLRQVMKKVNCKVYIVEKRGFPFLLHRIMRRKSLVAGGIAALLAMYILTSFIWVVEVKGNQEISQDRIIEELENLGLEPGVFKYSLDTDDIETKLIIKMDRIAWVGINIVGTKAVVDVVERVEPPSLLSKETPCNVVASRDGIITNIFVFEGEPAVKEGDTVKAGQVLITGIVEKPGMPVRFVHAMGKVQARTWYQAYEVQPLKIEKRERTGAVQEKVRLQLGKYSVYITPGKVSFEEYDIITRSKNSARWRNIIIPVELVIEKYYEVKVKEERLSEFEARQLAVRKIEQKLEEMIPEDAERVDKSVKYYEEDSERIRVEVILETLEDIGIEERINVTNRED